MKILLTGKTGQIGWELARTLAPVGRIIAPGRQALDLADPDSMRRVAREAKPDVIVNAAAYTAVDQAESEPRLALAVNGIAPGILAEEAKRLGALLVHYSTDYVFDGTKAAPYTEEDAPSPLNVYGKTKLAGEKAIQEVGGAHLIFRTSWVYGLRGKNFLLTILRLARERDELKIVHDQVGAPTWSRMVAEATALILASARALKGEKGCLERLRDHGGLYHLTCAGQTSWYGFARAILERLSESLSRPVPRLSPIPSSEYPLPAARPAFSVLSSDKLGAAFGLSLPDWQSCLALCLEEGAAGLPLSRP